MTNLAFRWSGLLLIAGVALLVAGLGIFLSVLGTGQPTPQLANALMFTASILLLLTLPAMYARQAEATGWLGFFGYISLQTGILLFVAVSAPPLLYSSFDLPLEESLTAFLLGIALTVGLLLTAIATIRAGVFPRWTGVLLLTGTAVFFFDFFIAELLPQPAMQAGTALMGACLGLSLAWIGLSMFTSPPRPIA